jgi:hypothetical protein
MLNILLEKVLVGVGVTTDYYRGLRGDDSLKAAFV